MYSWPPGWIDHFGNQVQYVFVIIICNNSLPNICKSGICSYKEVSVFIKSNNTMSNHDSMEELCTIRVINQI